MFGEIKLRSFQVEAVLNDFMLKAELQPRGQLAAFLNDRNWSFIPFVNGEWIPLAADRRVAGIKRTFTVVNKAHLSVISLLRAEEVADVTVPVTKRSVIFYLAQFAVQGQLHVSSDAPDEDLLDEMHDFYPLSEVSIYPLRPVASAPTVQVPMLWINRNLIQAYQVRQEPA